MRGCRPAVKVARAGRPAARPWTSRAARDTRRPAVGQRPSPPGPRGWAWWGHWDDLGRGRATTRGGGLEADSERVQIGTGRQRQGMGRDPEARRIGAGGFHSSDHQRQLARVGQRADLLRPLPHPYFAELPRVGQLQGGCRRSRGVGWARRDGGGWARSASDQPAGLPWHMVCHAVPRWNPRARARAGPCRCSYAQQHTSCTYT